MRKLFFNIFIIIIIILVSCSNKEVKGIVNPTFSGTYSYSSFDTTGTPIVKGWFSISFQESVTIKGEWHFEKIGDPENIGPQVGSGELEGGVDKGRIWIELQPKFRDNNLQLDGKIENNYYSGKWQWISFIGHTNYGTFVAVKK